MNNCDLCGIRNKEPVVTRLCQRHINEYVDGERDLKAERDEARAFAQKQYDRAEEAEKRIKTAQHYIEKVLESERN